MITKWKSFSSSGKKNRNKNLDKKFQVADDFVVQAASFFPFLQLYFLFSIGLWLFLFAQWHNTYI